MDIGYSWVQKNGTKNMLADSETKINMILISLFVLQVTACRLDVIYILLDSYAN